MSIALRQLSFVVQLPPESTISRYMPGHAIWGTELVGFRIDARGRLIGEAWVPKAGVTSSEFTSYLRAVAAECDRFEYQLTGSDAS